MNSNWYQTLRDSSPYDERMKIEHQMVAEGDHLKITKYIGGLLELICPRLSLSGSDTDDFKKEALRILEEVVSNYKRRFIDSGESADFLFSTFFITHLEDLVEQHSFT